LALAYPATAAFAAPPVPYTWTGYYTGLDAGYAWGNTATNCTFIPGIASPCEGTAIPNVKPQGGAFGVEIGADWQHQNWVFGLGGDVSALGLRDTAQFPSVDAGKTDEISSRYDWLGTARGRIGYAVGPSLFYGTGGLAIGRVRDVYNHDIAGSGATNIFAADTLTGWTAGAGWQYMFSDHWSLKLEYLHVDLGRNALDISGATNGGYGAAPGSSVLHFNNTFDLVRAGVSYKW